MHRFYVPPEQIAKDGLLLTGNEAHHAVRVLRIRRGERVIALDGTGGEFHCEVGDVTRGVVKLSVIEKRQVGALPCKITLLQGVPKGRIMESIVQKATELGAFRIVPLLTERVVARFDNTEALHKTDKWRSIAIEAIKQCGAAWLPQVTEPLTPQQFLTRRENIEMALVGSLQTDSRHLRMYFNEFYARTGRQPRSIGVWVGPEGDFSPLELETVKGCGAKPITLGPLVLRCETAAVYCLSVLNYELQSGSAQGQVEKAETGD